MFVLRIDPATELRELQPADAAVLFALTDENRAYLREWLPWVDDTRTVDDSLRFIEDGLRAWDEKLSLHAGIWRSGVLCGVISYNYLNFAVRLTELGYWIGAQHQRKGLATAASRALVTYAFEELNLLRVEIRCAVGNAKSRAIPRRLGFVEEGVVPQFEWLNGRYLDALVYSMTPEIWNTCQADHSSPR